MLQIIVCQKLHNLDEMDKFPGKHNIIKWTQEARENLNRCIKNKEIKLETFLIHKEKLWPTSLP